MDKMAPSEGADSSSIPDGATSSAEASAQARYTLIATN